MVGLQGYFQGRGLDGIEAEWEDREHKQSGKKIEVQTEIEGHALLPGDIIQTSEL